MHHIIKTPITKEICKTLHAGDTVLLSGTIYTARDAAHARMAQMIHDKKDLPIDITTAAIYYAGPTPAKPGEVIGSVGPTTSGRMDAYSPKLIDMGLKCIIGKGEIGKEVVSAIKNNAGVYFAALGGAGAVISACVKKVRLVCFEDLGSEAIRELTIENLPLVVAVDYKGENIYEKGPKMYKEQSGN